jgi:hypothetical protein
MSAKALDAWHANTRGLLLRKGADRDSDDESQLKKLSLG